MRWSRRTSPCSRPGLTATSRANSAPRKRSGCSAGGGKGSRPGGCARRGDERRSPPWIASCGTSATRRPRAPPPISRAPRSASSYSRAVGGDAMAADKQFRVAVTKDNHVFASAHFITFPGHRCETLHGHNYRTQVVVEGGLNPEAHYVVDFSELKQLMKRLTDEIDHKVLLPLQNPKIQVREDGDSVAVAVNGRPPYVFPKSDCALLPIPNTTVEMLAPYLAGRGSPGLTLSPGGKLLAIEVEVEGNLDRK